MERGQRRTQQQTRTGQPQYRPAHSPRPPRPTQPPRPANRKRKKNKSKTPWIIGAAVVLLIIIVGAIGGGNKDTSANNASTPSPTPAQLEHGTTAMLDDILAQAKADASGENGAEIAENAYAWIVSTVPEWYDGYDIMEQAIYNGAVVEYYFAGKNDVRTSVGMDTVQAVKYVYRGAESVLDEATQENINQIKESIEKDRGN